MVDGGKKLLGMTRPCPSAKASSRYEHSVKKCRWLEVEMFAVWGPGHSVLESILTKRISPEHSDTSGPYNCHNLR